jgi:hypothetical protein
LLTSPIAPPIGTASVHSQFPQKINLQESGQQSNHSLLEYGSSFAHETSVSQLLSMDAHAHLLSLGWAGPGHALDSRPYKQSGKRGLDYNPKTSASASANTGSGLIKPLMISQRKERFGIGKKDPKHEPAAGNEWWLKGFETALGNIGKSESERSGTQTPVMGTVRKHAGLYGFFVKGKEMEGTIGEELLKRSRKRKSDRISGSASESGGEVEGKKGIDETDAFAQTAAFIAVRDKDERRRKRAEKAGAMEEFEQATNFFEARSDRKEKKNNMRNSQMEPAAAEVIEAEDLGGPVREETKEERRARRRKRREEKAAKEVLQNGHNGDLVLSASDDTSKRKTKGERRGKRT